MFQRLNLLPIELASFGPFFLKETLANWIVKADSGIDFGKGFLRYAALNKESVEPKAMSSHQTIALFFTQLAHGSQGGSAEIFGFISKLRIVRDRQSLLWGDLIVGFTNHDTRLNDRNSFPHPVIHTVKVETEQVNRSAHAGLSNFFIYVFRGDPCGSKARRMKKCIFMVREKSDAVLDVSFIAIKQASPPAVIDNQV